MTDPSSSRDTGASLRSELVRRLADRRELPLELLAAESRAVPASAAVALLQALGRVLDVEPGRLRPRDRLELLFEAPEEATQGDPLGASLLKELAGITADSAWERMRETITPAPGTDAEWLNVMLGLRVDEWVRTWAPAVRDSSPGGESASGGEDP